MDYKISFRATKEVADILSKIEEKDEFICEAIKCFIDKESKSVISYDRNGIKPPTS